MILVTTTAVGRPEIFAKTLESFQKYLFRDFSKYELALNIDPVGSNSINEMIEIAHYYFGENNCIIRTPALPQFAVAFKFVWCQVKSHHKYVFHLEDDWELLEEINLQDMVNILEEEEHLALLRLPAFHATNGTMKNWNKFYIWNGKYFECPKELTLVTGFCGHPSLIKAEFVRDTAPWIDTNINPEKQFHHHNKRILEIVQRYRYGVFGFKTSTPIVADTGRKWIQKTEWRKEGNKAWFLNWKKKDD